MKYGVHTYQYETRQRYLNLPEKKRSLRFLLKTLTRLLHFLKEKNYI